MTRPKSRPSTATASPRATLKLPAGEEATIQITNTDDRAHDFAIEAVNLNTGTIEGGAVATATFTVPEGTTEFECTRRAWLFACPALTSGMQRPV